MSRSLAIECEWLDQPSTNDPLERQTWAWIRISAAGRTVTHLWDRQTQGERTTIFIPAFSLAQWIVTNWWALLYEPSRSENVPSIGSDLIPSQRNWLHRHCLRSADSGLLLPRMCLFSDGRNAYVQWSADEQDAYVHMPGYFVESGLVRIDPGDAERALREFVSKVLARTEAMDDARAGWLRDNWTAIAGADPAESAFCRAAARMGLDPYESHTWDSALVTLLESGIGDDPDKPLVEDFLEAADADEAVPLWDWVAKTEASMNLGASPTGIRISAPALPSAAATGYEAAQHVRNALGLDNGRPLADLEAVLPGLRIPSFVFQDHDHLTSRSVMAAVGWRAGQEPVIAGPKPSRPDNLRFLEARGLYHAVFACGHGPRLVTNAHTWDQRAARAFAAELLAPREALLARVRPNICPDSDLVASLASEYAVSARLIEHQFENAGIQLGVE